MPPPPPLLPLPPPAHEAPLLLPPPPLPLLIIITIIIPSTAAAALAAVDLAATQNPALPTKQSVHNANGSYSFLQMHPFFVAPVGCSFAQRPYKGVLVVEVVAHTQTTASVPGSAVVEVAV